MNSARSDSPQFSFDLRAGPEALLRRPSFMTKDPDSDGLYNYREGDTFELVDWKLFHTVNGE